MDLREACVQAMKDIYELKTPGGMNCLAIDAKGNTMSAKTNQDSKSVHWYMDVDMDEPERRIGINVSE